jgi:hypothetical protein
MGHPLLLGAQRGLRLRDPADPARVGVTGLSDGAESAVFALIHCGCDQ